MENNLLGTRLGKYQIHAEIGRGGMGTVYKGYDPALDRYVAVKVLAPHLVWEKEFVERFLREARAAARLKHAHIVTIHDVGQAEGWYYFVMEYLEGPALTDFIRQRGPLPLDEVIRILRPLADALDYAHHQGLIHRDVKPGNVIVGPAGHVTLTDFGIARAARETRLTTTGAIVGTPEYMSPEQAQGLTVDARSDQYSLAVVAYEILSGRVPFEAESTLALLHKIVYEPPSPIYQVQPGLPAGIEPVMNKVLSKEPGDRYANVSAFVEALGLALAGEEVVKRPTLVLEPETAPAPIPERTKVLPPAMQQAAVSAPEPVQAAAPVFEPERAKVASPGMQPAIPVRRRVPVWAWALGGLAVLVLMVGLVIWGGREERQVSVSTPAVAQATSTLRPELTPAATLPIAGSKEIQQVFVSDRDGKQEVYHLTRTGEVERITHTSGDGESWSPVLVSDGTFFFTSDRDGKWEIYHLTRTGEVERITHTPDGGESWAPVPVSDGTLFFTSDRDGKREVYHLTRTGEVERVTHTPGDGESWSPVPVSDGTLFFASDRDGKWEIYHLTRTGEVERITHTSGDGESWSPVPVSDGTVFFTSDRDGKQEVYHLTGTGEVERITHTPGDGESWSPVPVSDGTLFFTSDRDGKREVYHLTRTGEVERVTHTPGNGESWLSG
ncbi:MAG: protein kinase [Chloroflexota bacterium]|nr:protein kinase [Chloroflexota bacterium]